MNETAKQILIAWYKAYEQVEDNTSLMMNHSTLTNLCVARMNVCSVADELLYSLPIMLKIFQKNSHDILNQMLTRDVVDVGLVQQEEKTIQNAMLKLQNGLSQKNNYQCMLN